MNFSLSLPSTDSASPPMPGWMGYVSDSELERMRFDSSFSNKAHCLSTLYKLIGYCLTVQAICLCTTYVISVKCMCTLEGRVSMFRWMAAEDMHNIRCSAFLLFSLLCNVLVVSSTVPLGRTWSWGFSFGNIKKRELYLSTLISWPNINLHLFLDTFHI
jgi:hypothetical protein